MATTSKMTWDDQMTVPSTSKSVVYTETAAAAHTLKVYEQDVMVSIISAEDEADIVTITLPNVDVAEGLSYYIVLTNAPGNTETVVITDNGESLEWTDLTLDTQYDYAKLTAKNGRWIIDAKEVAP